MEIVVCGSGSSTSFCHFLNRHVTKSTGGRLCRLVWLLRLFVVGVGGLRIMPSQAWRVVSVDV